MKNTGLIEIGGTIKMNMRNVANGGNNIDKYKG